MTDESASGQPDAFDHREALAVQVAEDDGFESVVYDGVASRTGRCRALPLPDANRSVVAAYRVPEGGVTLENVTNEYR